MLQQEGGGGNIFGAAAVASVTLWRISFRSTILARVTTLSQEIACSVFVLPPAHCWR